MGALVQCCYRVYMKNDNVWTYYTSNWPQDINGNLLTDKTTSKISIQAPPGTVVQIEGKNFIIGRSGIFDFDNDDITVSSLLFPAAADNSQEWAAIERILQEIRADLGADINKSDSDFCESLKQEYFQKIYSTYITDVVIESWDENTVYQTGDIVWYPASTPTWYPNGGSVAYRSLIDNNSYLPTDTENAAWAEEHLETFVVAGISGAIEIYDELQEATNTQNRDLKNIIVNYVEND